MEVLLVEDDRPLAARLAEELSADGHRVHTEHTGPGALAAARRGGWGVIVLDVGLPGISGFEVLRCLRSEASKIPVVFLSALSEVADRVRGLLLGGDDYLTKPFAMDELKARLRVVDRRQERPTPASPAVPRGWELHPLLREATVDGTRVSLQPREWSLLELFLSHPGEVLTKSFILERAWGIRFDPGTNVVDAVVCRLRRKLDRPGKPSRIGTLRGRGYVFHPDAQA